MRCFGRVRRVVARMTSSLLVPFVFLLCGQAKADEYRGQIPDICQDNPTPNPGKPKSVVFQLTEFERTPHFAVKEWKHDFLPAQFGSFRLGDFDCDGRADILAFDPSSRQLILGVSDGNHSFQPKLAGEASEVRNWSSVTVARLQKSACALAITPANQESGIHIAQLCGDYKFRWQTQQIFDQNVPVHFLRFGKRRDGLDERFYTNWHIADVLVIGWFNLEHGFRKEFKPTFSIDSATFSSVMRITHGMPSYFVAENSTGRFTYLTDERLGELALPFFLEHDSGSMAAGDINGDGLDDLVIPSSTAQGSWIAFSYGGELLEFPNVTLTSALRKRKLLGTEDFDGDGRDDLLLAEGNRLFIGTITPGAPQGHKGVSVNGKFHVSDENGRIELGTEGVSKFEVDTTESKEVVLNPRFTIEVDRTSRRPVPIVYDNLVKGEVGAIVNPLQSDDTGPFICASYTFGSDNLYRNGRNSFCPEHYAFMEIDDAGPVALGTCCKLPKSDILTKSFEWMPSACPDDSILTAIQLYPILEVIDNKKQRPYYRCSKINTAKYMLGPPTEGILYGEGGSLSIVSEDLDRSRIPLAARKGFGMIAAGASDPDGCVGKPWGALLTGIKGRDCHQRTFRTLLRKSDNGPPVPVPVLPKCAKLLDIYDPSRGCIPEK